MTPTNRPTSSRSTNKMWIAGLAAGLLTGGGVALVATLPGGAGASTPAVQSDDTTVTDGATGSTDSTGTADTERPERGQWLEEALAPLVEDGTLTQDQADAVIAALADARPEGHGPGGMGGRGMGGPIGAGLDAVATELGLTVDEIRTALQDGQTLAELADANGSSAQALIDVLVAEAETHLAEHVTAGDITQDEADTRLAEATERITAMVNGELPVGGPGGRGPGGFGGHHGPMGDDDAATDDATGS